MQDQLQILKGIANRLRSIANDLSSTPEMEKEFVESISAELEDIADIVQQAHDPSVRSIRSRDRVFQPEIPPKKYYEK